MNGAARVLLVNPTITKARHARFPLAVLSLSAALEGKFTPVIIDGNVDRDFIATAVRAAGEPRVAAVGVTVMGGPQLLSAIALSKAIRERHPSLPIVWGGAFPTVCPDSAVSAAYVDYVVRGQGEATFVELLEALAGGGELGAIAGITRRA
jgi:anaerobic magnesium-protoporphyrin IX monomethyl ester cyclase